jgi:hypothetical protein
MKSVRVLFVVLGLSALPLFAIAAQGNGNGNQCKTAPSSPNGRGVGLAAAPGQVKKCPVTPPAPPPPPPPPPPAPPPAPPPPPPPAPPPPPPPPPAPVPPPPPPPPAPVPPPPPPPPPPSSPPSGINFANGIVFEDLDGNGVRDPFAGEMGLEGWTVELWWNGQVLATTTTDADGLYQFPNLGNTTYSLCIQPQGGYTQTLPVGGTGCGGSGYTFSFSGTFQQMFPGKFGEMLQ